MPLTIPLPLSDALSSISLVHLLSSWLRRLDPWSMIYSMLSAAAAQNSIQLFPYCQVFRHSVCLQSGWLRIIWKWERGSWWDRFEIWSKLIEPWLIKTDQTERGQKQTMDLWELKGKLKRVELVSQNSKNICFDQISLVRMCCMIFCLLVQFVHLRPWELGRCSGKQVQASRAVLKQWVHSPGKKNPFELPLRATGHAIIFAIISINVHQRI